MAVTKDQKIIRYGTYDGHQSTSQPMKANAACYAGTIALTDSTGYVKSSATVAATDKCWGIINGLKDGSPHVTTPITAGTTNGDTVIGIDTGTFFLTPGLTTDALTQADIGAVVYVIDEVTVGKTDGSASRPIAGRLAEIGTGQYAGLVAVTLGIASNTGSP
jgi:hypothetical protein